MKLEATIIRFLALALIACIAEATWGYDTQHEFGEEQASHNLKIETQYNDSTGTSRSLLHSMPVPTIETAEFNHLYVNAAIDYPRSRPSIPEIVKVGFDSRPCHMSDKSGPDVTIWAESRFVYSGKLQRLFCDGGIGRESEFGTIDVPLDSFIRIAEAMKVEVQIGEHQFVLSENAQEGFRKLAHFVRGG